MGKRTDSLLEVIRDDAIDNSVDVATILRKCQVLASKLGNVQFSTWVSCELNGYFEHHTVPKYRIKIVDSYGTLMGMCGQQLTNAPLSFHNLPTKIARALSTAKFTQGIETLQDLVENGNGRGITYVSWPAEVMAKYAGVFYVDMNLVAAHKAIPRSAIKGILSTVRNKVLEFVLQISAQLGNDLSDIKSNQEATGKVTSIVNMYITGDGNRVAANCQSVDQSLWIGVSKGNWELLSATLSELNVAKDKQRELKQALDQEPPTSPTNLGSKVSSWLGRVLAKVGTETTVQLIVKAIGVYCGFTGA